MKLSAITARTVDSTLNLVGEEVPVTFRPAVHTSAFEDEMRTAMAANDSLAMAGLLARLVVSVDISDDDGQLIECTGESFYRLLPLEVMTEMWSAATEALRPGGTKGATSAAG